MDKIYDYLMVGAGLTGAVIAHELHKKGKSVLVVDKRDHIGGNCYTHYSDSIIVHKYGAHIFHTNKKGIGDYINSFDEFIPYYHQVKANYKETLYDLPFNLNTYQQIYQTDPINCIKLLNNDIAKYKDLIPTNLEEQALKLVGDKIYTILIKGYTEKQWGRPCASLDKNIIKRLPLRTEANNNYFNDSYQGIPKNGYTALINNLLSGTDIKLNYKYSKNNNEIKANRIINTGPIDEFYEYCYGSLEYRSLRFEHEKLNCKQFQQYSVINFPEKNIPYTRIIEHKHFNNSTEDYTIITKEFPESYSVDKERYYPVNNSYTEKLYKKYSELAQQDNIIFCGRLGGYMYLDMDKAIEEAFKVLANL